MQLIMNFYMKNIIETIHPMGVQLLGSGYDNALKFINHLIPLEVLEFPSGTKVGTWTIPDEWVIKDGWVKFEGEKIIDYTKNPLSVVIYSQPINTKMDKGELQKHLYYSDDFPNQTPYVYKFYEKDWGFCVPRNKIKEVEHEVLNIETMTVEKPTSFKDILKDGEYEVFIDSEFKPGTMKIGTHTIKGKSDREILLFAHLDHPYQANDNLSGVACLIDLARKIKSNHTIKIILCPETIGSITYALTQDISKVDFMIAVDICGNEGPVTLQKSWNVYDKINLISHLAIHSNAQNFKKGNFRALLGSDEYVFNDPLIGIPGVFLSTYPYDQYHTDADTPEIISYKAIENVQNIILKIIEIYEKDFIPKRLIKGPLMRSKYNVQTTSKQMNLSWDYFWYSIDGKRSIAELAGDYGLPFDIVYETMLKLEQDGTICRSDVGQKPIKKTTSKKHKRV
jgi:aminopeptidase-like protein